MNALVVGLDGSEHSRLALRRAAGATAAGVRAVHVWRTTESERPPRTGERLRTRAADAVEGWAPEVTNDLESDEMEGNPRDVIARAAERFDPALTVVGRRRFGGPRSMRLGGTANHLVRHAPADVAVVPLTKS
jgi:nucleotide-binding universal stress UspA family protein